MPITYTQTYYNTCIFKTMSVDLDDTYNIYIYIGTSCMEIIILQVDVIIFFSHYTYNIICW